MASTLWKQFHPILVLLVLASVAFTLTAAGHKHKKEKFHNDKQIKHHHKMQKMGHVDKIPSNPNAMTKEESKKYAEQYDVTRFSKHSIHDGKHIMLQLRGKADKLRDRKLKLKAKKLKRMNKKLGWMKFRSESDCHPKCVRGEFCIIGPLDPKPFCVRKKSLKKSMKLFHRYQKKEMKEWRKFEKEHYRHHQLPGETVDQGEKPISHLGKLKEKHLGKHGHGYLKAKYAGKKHRKPLVPADVDENGCSTSDFVQMRSRLLGWFHVLHGQDHLLKKKEKGSLKHFHKHNSVKKELREHDGASCECYKSAMWQFHELDTDSSDALSQAELASVEENSLEPCVQPYLQSCDRDKDGTLTSDEWCCCFSSVVAPCFKKLDELRKSAGKVSYMPRCDREGYYMREQCQGELRGDDNFGCWCVDYNGNEYKDTFTKGRAHCSKIALRGLQEKMME